VDSSRLVECAHFNRRLQNWTSANALIYRYLGANTVFSTEIPPLKVKKDPTGVEWRFPVLDNYPPT